MFVSKGPVATLKTERNTMNIDAHHTRTITSNGNGHRLGPHYHPPMTATSTEEIVQQLLQAIGEDPARQGLQRTPERVARMYEELTAGYHVDPHKLINGALFDVDYREMVVVKEIEFYSLCEHHLLPFFGQAHVAYVPSDRVIGLSKIPRIVEMFARRLQVQERMTQQIAGLIDEILQPLGVGVVIQGQHMCSMMRGVKKAQASMVTSALLGSFKTIPHTRAEFMAHIYGTTSKGVSQ
jgi:GTP cyclohydrolase I